MGLASPKQATGDMIMKKTESKKGSKSSTKAKTQKVADAANVAAKAPEATTGAEAAPIAAPTAQERDVAAKAGPAPKQAAKGKKAPAEPKAKKMSALDTAAQVLKEAGQPMNAKAICEAVLAKGWKTNGKTPASTIYAAIIREIATKGKDARFRKTDRGLFTVNG
jgi:hypothetical protein